MPLSRLEGEGLPLAPDGGAFHRGEAHFASGFAGSCRAPDVRPMGAHRESSKRTSPRRFCGVHLRPTLRPVIAANGSPDSQATFGPGSNLPASVARSRPMIAARATRNPKFSELPRRRARQALRRSWTSPQGLRRCLASSQTQFGSPRRSTGGPSVRQCYAQASRRIRTYLRAARAIESSRRS